MRRAAQLLLGGKRAASTTTAATQATAAGKRRAAPASTSKAARRKTGTAAAAAAAPPLFRSKKPVQADKLPARTAAKNLAKKAAKKPVKQPATRPKKRASPAASSSPSSPDPLPVPQDWRATYDLLEELRADRSAPVDAFGSEALPQRPPLVTQEDFHYQSLVALMLSSQTKDQVVGACMARLQAHGLTVANIATRTSDEELHALLRGPPAVGFHNMKLKYIRKTTAILHEELGGVVPGTLEGLLAFPGVGPKMALIVLNAAFGRQDGVAIDTHLHRMLNQLGWTTGCKQPEQTRRQLEAWLPRDVWGDINLIWVGVGQELQQEPGKLLRKVLACSDRDLGLRLLRTFGMNLEKVAAKHGIVLP